MKAKLNGLSHQEVIERQNRFGLNEFKHEQPKRLWHRIATATRQPMFLLLIFAGLINFVLADIQDGLVLFLFVVGVIAISIYQENRTESAISSLRKISAPTATVIRAGEKLLVSSREIVPDDLVIVREGDRVPADGKILNQANLLVDESSLTGESIPVTKSAEIVPTDRTGEVVTDKIFAGTLVIKGTATFIVTQTGGDTELGKLQIAVQGIANTQTPLQLEVNRLVNFVAVAGLSAAAFTTIIFGITREDWVAAVLVGISTTMALLPEEFPVVLSVFLAIGSWRLSKLNVLTRRSPVIETLGSATVICVDKTGTLTENKMEVRLLSDLETVVEANAQAIPSTHTAIAEALALASDMESPDPMDRAFIELAANKVEISRLVQTHEVEEHRSPTEGRMISVSKGTNSTGAWFAAKGAPEAIANLCGLSENQQRLLFEQASELASSGLRVLAVAKTIESLPAEMPIDNYPGARFQLLGLVGLHDPARVGIAQSIAVFNEAGVRILMVTGDYPATALAIARDVGIGTKFGAITGPEFEAISDIDLIEVVKKVNVFARMQPTHKLRLINALRNSGEVVGMTGDGVNDAPALRAAHIGIAMGLRGTEVAREAAAIVLTDDSFTSIERAIRQGRVINDNLRKAMVYIVAVHIPIFGMTIFPLSSSLWPLVLLPLQIAFLELLIDPVCSVAFESEAADMNVMRRRPRPLNAKIFGKAEIAIALIQGLANLVVVAGVYLYGIFASYPDLEVKTLTFVTLVLSNILTIAINRSWQLGALQTIKTHPNRIFNNIVIFAVLALVVITSINPLNDSFGLTRLGIGQWMLGALAAALGSVWFEVYKYWKFRASYLQA